MTAVNAVEWIIQRVTLDEIFSHLTTNIETNQTTVGKIVSNDLHYRKICIR